MNKKIEKILEIWHEQFSHEENQYSEYEPSDIEYFVGCLLYNYFAFTKALGTMKTMDLSYDFIEGCGDEYDEIQTIIKSIEFDTDVEKLKFLQDYISDSQAKYSGNELYLLNRLDYHISEMALRYEHDIQAQRVKFEAPKKKSANPLIR